MNRDNEMAVMMKRKAEMDLQRFQRWLSLVKLGTYFDRL